MQNQQSHLNEQDMVSEKSSESLKVRLSWLKKQMVKVGNVVLGLATSHDRRWKKCRYVCTAT